VATAIRGWASERHATQHGQREIADLLWTEIQRHAADTPAPPSERAPPRRAHLPSPPPPPRAALPAAMGLLSRLATAALLAGVAAALLAQAPAARGAAPPLATLAAALDDAWAHLRPGGAWHPAAFIERRGHTLLEGGLLAAVAFLLFRPARRPAGAKARAPLTERETAALCAEWEPEPLAPPVPPAAAAWLAAEAAETAPAAASARPKAGAPAPALDFSAFDFLGLRSDPAPRAAARAAIARYGVGSCGPRGFYGTIDVHLELEAGLAAAVGAEEAILYSYDLATLPSLLPAFAGRGDLLVLDDALGWAARSGAALSRARVLTFAHGDVADLERVLRGVAAEDAARPGRPLRRRFVVVEGVAASTGRVAPLAAIAALKDRYKYRLVVDESCALGVLGAGGRGAAEAAGLAPADVDVLAASLGNAAATAGGFCAGAREVADHQRLGGAGYCFSASLPPYLAAAGLAALPAVAGAEGAARRARARAAARAFRAGAAALPGLALVGGAESAESPVAHLRLAAPPAGGRAGFAAGDLLLAAVAADCLARGGVRVALAKYSPLEAATRPPPSLRVALSAVHSAADIEAALAALRGAAERVLLAGGGGGARRARK
jgi:serine palmitoyltransferase